MPAEVRVRLLADMNISPQTVRALQQGGYDVVRVSQLLPASAPDEDVLDLARQQGRVLLTQDLDFSALLALGGHSGPSVVTVRLARSDPATVTRRVLETLPAVAPHLQRGCVVTVEDASSRVRRLPID